MSANYKQLSKFAKDIERLNAQQKEEFLEACCKELAARLLRDVIHNTPVGKKPKAETKSAKVTGSSGKKKSFLTADEARIQQYWSDYQGGTLRRGWTVSTHEEAESGKDVSVKEWCDTVKVRVQGNTYVLDVINPVQYAVYVEYGHRQNVGKYIPALGKQLKQGWVEGKFILTTAEAKLNTQADAILAQKLRKFMKEVFGE